MLRLENIKKNYYVADTVVEALKGVNLSFRKNEFVSILGPSGCGKTTLLNIIGGLDKYSDGDLYINGRSTKEFKDADWDVYRNHRIGFIFQSYNLIPHQTILGNVELALTIAGISKEERIARAKAAIDKVGLKGQYYKHPNQLSGGQCQRVAIARALVNEPEILLADEPTGALDTVTSVQIMDLIKEIAKEKLVIMVTHNPELAEQYSTRIVRLLDGELQSDSNPFSKEEEIYEVKKLNEESKKEQNDNKKKEKAKMSLWTSFKLSLRNLFSKKGRTTLTCIAGSIGIIGVASVLSVSNGIQGYITSMQDDMLSGNPITITETAYDLTAMMNGMSTMDKVEAIDIEDGKIYVDQVIKQLLNTNDAATQMQVKNEITKEYIDYILSIDENYVAATTLDYGIEVINNIYTDFQINNADKEKQNISLAAIRNNYTSVLGETKHGAYASYVTSLTNVFQQAPNDVDYILSQYDLVAGEKVATEENEIMIVLSKDQKLTDLLLAQLGIYTQEQFLNSVYSYSDLGVYDEANDKKEFTFEEVLGKEFTWYPNDSVYTKNVNPMTGEIISVSPFKYKHNSKDINEEGMKFKITGILQPKETISYGCMTSGFFYTEAFSKKILASSLESEIVKYISSLPENNRQIISGFQKVQIAGSNTPLDESDDIYKEFPIGINYEFEYQAPLKNDAGVYEKKTGIGFIGGTDAASGMIMQFLGLGSGTYYTLSNRALGGESIPNMVKIYPTDFELKDGVTEHLDKWNKLDEDLIYTRYDGEVVTILAKDRTKVTYTDSIAIIIDIINSLIDIITTALIAFTCLALVVSCFMIAIVTYVSVVERVKEIGVIRSLGGRKKDVTNLFNAETFIIGLFSGIFGIAVTYLISFVLSIVVKHFTGVYPIAKLPVHQALLMIGISILLTVVSGLIPARSAAKKDPVVALRTE